MSHVYINEIASHAGQTVTLKGWLYNVRSSGKILFLQLRDGTGLIQAVVVKKEVSPEVWEVAAALTQESSVIVTGVVREDTRSTLGFELGVTTLELVSASVDYPITPKEHGVAFLMDHRHLWIRSRMQHAVLLVRDEVIRAIRDFFASRHFVNIDAPIFTPNACEGTTNLFATNYFDTTAYLSQSGQLYMEAGAMAFGKVFCFGPTFRAEKSKTRRHLTEFWMVEPEVAYLELEGIMNLAEDFLCHIVERVLNNRRKELELLERDISKLENVRKPFPRMSYDAAIEILASKGKPVPWGDDLGADEETVLTQELDRPLMVSRYPTAIKAFYMKEDPANPKVVLGVDVLAPEGYGEIIGGGQREDNLDILTRKIDEHQLPQSVFEWYKDLRRYGSVPHGGFGLGLERTVTWICGIHHLREAIPFPRLMDRLAP